MRGTSRFFALWGAITIAATAGWIDYHTGFQLRLGPFYLTPVLVAAWNHGLVPGLLAAVVAASVWDGIGIATRSDYSHGLLLYWSWGSHLLSFAAMAWAAAWARGLLERARESTRALSRALEEVETLKGLLPICAWCKKVRDDRGYWEQIEVYISKRSKATWTHGICPECFARVQAEHPPSGAWPSPPGDPA